MTVLCLAYHHSALLVLLLTLTTIISPLLSPAPPSSGFFFLVFFGDYPHSDHIAVIHALNDYAVTGLKGKDTLWGVPLIRVVIRPPAAAGGGGGGSAAAAPSAATHNANHPATLKLQVYVSRLLFYLIADDAVKQIVASLDSATANVVHALEPTPSHPAVFSSTYDAETTAALNAYEFTLAGLLKSCENLGYAEAPQPAGITFALKQYQLMGCQFMADLEGSPRGVNGKLWEERSWPDGKGSFYYSPLLGELRLGDDIPPTVRGGLICDEMGMGKTVVVASRIVADKLAGFPPPADHRRNTGAIATAATGSGGGSGGVGGGGAVGGGGGGGAAVAATSTSSSSTSSASSTLNASSHTTFRQSTATLVVAPVSLLRQWASELAKCTQEGLLSVATYTMEELEKDRGTSNLAKGRRVERLQHLCTMDVVLTSYRALEADKHVLHKIQWRRICLDEMQEIRSSTTKLAKSCASLLSDFRWMISGTPLYTSIDDLYGTLSRQLSLELGY